jgi:hypothetical protein
MTLAETGVKQDLTIGNVVAISRKGVIRASGIIESVKQINQDRFDVTFTNGKTESMVWGKSLTVV